MDFPTLFFLEKMKGEDDKCILNITEKIVSNGYMI